LEPPLKCLLNQTWPVNFNDGACDQLPCYVILGREGVKVHPRLGLDLYAQLCNTKQTASTLPGIDQDYPYSNGDIYYVKFAEINSWKTPTNQCLIFGYYCMETVTLTKQNYALKEDIILYYYEHFP